MEHDRLNIELPIYTDEGIRCCIEDCLKPNKKNEKGQNREHRNMKLSSYRDKNVGDVIQLKHKNQFMCEIIRYTAKSLFAEFSKKTDDSKDTLIETVSPDFIQKNPELKDMKIQLLDVVANMSDDEIMESIHRNRSIIDFFIDKVFKSMNLWDGDSLAFGEHVCTSPIYCFLHPDLSDVGINKYGSSVYSKRIYMNGATDVTQLQFILEVLKKCIDKRIPCDMKPCFSSGIDGTIYYATNENFDSLLDAINETIDENRELLSCFGSPIISGANVVSSDGNSYYAFYHGGSDSSLGDAPVTYNDRVDLIINATYCIACLKLIQYYWTYIYKKCPAEVSALKSLSIHSYEDLYQILQYQKVIRTLAYDIIEYHPVEEIMPKLEISFKTNLGAVTSLCNFKDLDHKDVPMYKNSSFFSSRKQELDDMFLMRDNPSKQEENGKSILS